MFFAATEHHCEIKQPKIERREWFASVLELAQNELVFSTTTAENIEKNKIIIHEVDCLIEEAMSAYPSDVSIRMDCIRLLYIQGNHYLYTDRPVIAQTKLLRAKILCEHGEASNSPLDMQKPQQICRKLSQIDKRLPSFYAMVIRLLGKAYVFPWDEHNQLLKEEGALWIKKAIAIREYIDCNRDKESYLDHLDNCPKVGNTHLFKCDLGYVYLDQGNLDEAEKIYLELIQIKNELNQMICLKRLLKIYQRKGQQAAANKNPHLEIEKNYYRAHLCASNLIKLIEKFPDVYRISLPLAWMGELYSDPHNPWCDLELGNLIFKQAKNACFDDLQSISMRIHHGINQIYSEMAKKAKIEEQKQKWKYAETSSSDYLRAFNDKQQRQASAYSEMGDVYCEKKEFLTATILYSNAISVLGDDRSDETFRNKLMKKMEEVEYTYLPFHFSIDYSALIAKYRQHLQEMRSQVEIKKNLAPIQEIFIFVTSQYKALINLMLQDIFDQMGDKIKESFVCICGGSTSWNMATPFSDIELAFLIDPKCGEEARSKIQKIHYLLALRICAIGESPASYSLASSLNWLDPDEGPSPRGFMLDPHRMGNQESFFLGTPQELVKEIKQQVMAKRPHLSLAYTHASFICGNEAILDDYEKELHSLFPKEEVEEIAKDIVWRSLMRFEPKGYHDQLGNKYSLKHDFYRSFDLILYDLAFKLKIREAQTPWELIDILSHKQIIPLDMAARGKSILDLVGRLRIATYLHAKRQREWIKESNQERGDQKSYPVDKKDIEDILQFLGEFQTYVRRILKKEMGPDTCHGSVSHNIGKIALQEGYFEEAESHLRKAIKFYGQQQDINHPFFSDLFLDLGWTLIEQNKLKEGIDYISKRVEQDEQFYGKTNPKVSEGYYRLGLGFTKIGHHHEAKEAFEKAMQIDIIMYGPYHLRLNDYYREMGKSLLHLHDPMGAEKYFDLVLQIDARFLSEKDPLVSYDRFLLNKAKTTRPENLEEYLITPCAHRSCREKELSEKYRKTYTLFKAQELYLNALERREKGDHECAESLLNYAKIVKAAYFKRP